MDGIDLIEEEDFLLKKATLSRYQNQEEFLIKLKTYGFVLISREGKSVNIIKFLLNSIKGRQVRYDFLYPKVTDNHRSLSGKYGLNNFPLHTDGAHLANAPDYVILFAPKSREAKTLLINPKMFFNIFDYESKSALFSVQRKNKHYKQRFLSKVGGKSIIKYNIDTMNPCNDSAIEINRRMARIQKNAMEVYWNKFYCVVVDNRSVLHGRSGVSSAQKSYIRRLQVML